MKNKILKNTILVGALCTILVVPSYAQAAKLIPELAEDIKIMPISYKFDHWAETYVDRLSKDYDIETLFKDKDLDAAITVEDFRKSIKLTIDKEYGDTSETITREAVVNEFANIWAKKTGQNLNDISVIKMIIYPDTIEIAAEYNHSVTVAYMKDIAKGRDTGVFDPKAEVTYGELATLIDNTKKAIENELKKDNQPIVEGRFETQGSYELKEDKVIFNFELMSHYTEPKQLTFSSGQQFEVTITNEKGEEVYRYSDDRFFTLALVSKSIKPGEILKWQDEWDMTDKEGEKLTSGKYTAKINIIASPEENEGKFEESQLTTEIDFVLK